MSLIKSISGIRGTIGGQPGTGLTPVDVVKFAAAYGLWVRGAGGKKIVIGRDARVSGEMVSDLVCATLTGIGLDVVDLGLSTTPTVEIAVPREVADGGIILTASHNPGQWNALKLLNHKGEFISDAEGMALMRVAESGEFDFAPADKIGTVTRRKNMIRKHIRMVLK
ncbi:MAG: phosphoglucosamine mutase, partial [Bacteroidota bacterium]